MVESALRAGGKEFPLVTVVVTAYNIDQFLSKCIDSLIHQTENRLELIIVNDGSTDETACVANYYANLDPRIRVVHQENKGVSASRNIGLSQANGRFICFLDGDDWFEPEMVEHMVRWCESSNSEVVVAGAIVDFHDENGNLESSTVRVPPRRNVHRGEKVPALFDENIINLIGYLWNKMYDRLWLVASGEKFDEGLSLYEDLDFNSRVLRLANRSAFFPMAFVHYIQRPSPSLGKQYSENLLELRYRAIQNVDRLMVSYGIEPNAREERLIQASFEAIRGCLSIAVQTEAPTATFKTMINHPQAQELLKMGLLRHPRNPYEYGIIASLNHSNFTALIVISKLLHLVKVLRRFIKRLLKSSNSPSAPILR